jgi:hypothetical protein
LDRLCEYLFHGARHGTILPANWRFPYPG